MTNFRRYFGKGTFSLLIAFFALVAEAVAVPALLNHQGRIAVRGLNFDGAGQFKFALVNGSGAITYWSNDGTSTAGSQPAAHVPLVVTKGLYAVLLGDTRLTAMTPLPGIVFDNDDLNLRIWFNDGATGFQQITPDQRLASAPYSMTSGKTASVGGVSALDVAAGTTLANAATPLNTPGALVRRDSSGNFRAGTVTADRMLANQFTGNFVGDGSGLTGISPGPQLLSGILAPPVNPVIAWGQNSNGQTVVPALSGVVAIAAGNTQNLALLGSGNIIAWGGGLPVPAGLGGVSHIAAGAAHFLARRNDGSVVAWGDNTYQQTAVPAGLVSVANVAAGEKHSLVFLTNGSVMAWGDNTFGQTNLPAAAIGITAIACGYDHNLALKADGTVVAWGRNDSGQASVPAGLSNVIAIGAGAYHSLAVKSDGTVTAWGWDAGGQSTVPAGLTGVSAVAGGYTFSLARKADGTLVAWGNNSNGQTVIPSAARQITAIAAGAFHALALRAPLIPAEVARLDQRNVFTEPVGIRRAPATNALEVEGQASKSTAGNWLANSDRRIKTGIEPITGALEKLDRVRLVDFRYTPEYLAAHPDIVDKRYLNVVAQEFAGVFPGDVKSSGEMLPDGSPILQVDTYPLTIYSAAAIQELRRENEALKKTINEQEQRLLKLEKALHGN